MCGRGFSHSWGHGSPWDGLGDGRVRSRRGILGEGNSVDRAVEWAPHISWALK